MTSSPSPTAGAPAAPAVSVSPPPRALAPDLARGVMLALIAMANVAWHLWDQPGSGMSPHVTTGGPLDSAARFAMITAVDGRAYPLFAFLFGYGMVQFAASRARRGWSSQRVRRSLRRRHWALLLLGLLHAALLFVGDILGAYGLIGLLAVWLLFGCSDRTLAWVAGIIAALLAVGAVLSTVSGLLMLAITPAEQLDAITAGSAVGSEWSRQVTAGQQNYLIAALFRTIGWAMSTVGQLLYLVIPLCVLLGWLAARHRVLEEPSRHRRLLVLTAALGIPLGWAVGAVTALDHAGILPIHDALFWMLMAPNYTAGIAAGLGYAALLALLADHLQKRGTLTAAGVSGALLRAFAAMGQRSLSFYLAQSVVFAVLLNAWGLGLGAHVSTAASLLLALAVWATGLPVASLMARRGMRGPAERLLRRLSAAREVEPHAPGGRPDRRL